MKLLVDHISYFYPEWQVFSHGDPTIFPLTILELLDPCSDYSYNL